MSLIIPFSVTGAIFRRADKSTGLLNRPDGFSGDDIRLSAIHPPKLPMSKASAKTNAARILDRLKLPYQVLAYAVDPDDLAAESTAAKLGLPPEQVFKTLVARGDRQGVCLAVVPGNAQLDLKALASLAGERKVETVPLKDVQPLTGYIRGGVTALGTKKTYPVYVDDSILIFDQVAVSAGKRGLMLWLAPQDYLTATQAALGPLAKS